MEFFFLISAELADGPERHVIKNTVDAVNGFSGAVNQRRRVAAGPGHTRAFGPECAVHCRQEQHPVCVACGYTSSLQFGAHFSVHVRGSFVCCARPQKEKSS